MGSSHHYAVPSLAHQRPERRRKTHLRNATLAHRGGFGIRATYHVSDDHEIRFCAIDVLCAVRREHLDLPRGEHVAHRWIDILVAAGDRVAFRLEHPGEGTHSGPSDTDEVNALHRARR